MSSQTYLLVVWLSLTFLKPGPKSGIASGKPLSKDESKAIDSLIKFGRTSGKVLNKDSIAGFASSLRAKAERSGRPADAEAAKLAHLLVERNIEDVLGRVNALTSMTLEVGGAKAVYNAYQVCFNVLMVYILFSEVWKYAGGDALKLWSTMPDTSSAGNLIQFGVWLHYINKFLEYADSIFMAASGSWRQLGSMTGEMVIGPRTTASHACRLPPSRALHLPSPSTLSRHCAAPLPPPAGLHIIHHAIMGPIWFHVIWATTGAHEGNTQAWFSACANSFIHVLMYSYYLLSSLGVPLAWFRMPMTTAQMIQFYAVFAHSCVHLYYTLVEPKPWALPLESSLLEMATSVLMMFMFTKFFVAQYCASKPRPKPKAA